MRSRVALIVTMTHSSLAVDVTSARGDNERHATPLPPAHLKTAYVTRYVSSTM